MMNPSPETNERETSGAQICARCGAPFRCGMLAGDSACWCANMPVLPADLLRPGMRCLCPACLAAEIGRASRAD
ncbi:cysteine-rich CWC family protein [Caballeronia sp. J97]|uniref:cysteine-rich CWC family protein n=1 Tax=Caballeronia sp. J97 TaxID=2805429 RepID=UPI002AB297DD|nr:cysteine-rich CWC family protein [Caballeronia sp. J97]